MNASVIGVIVVVVLAAFGAGYLVGAQGAAVSVPEGDVGTTLEADDAGSRAPPEQLQSPGLESDPRAASSLRSLVAAYPLPRPPSGDGVIRGTVVSELGEPVARVEVSAIPIRERRTPTFSKDPETALVQRLQMQIESAKWAEGATVKAMTDAAGAFTLQGLSEVAHRIRAEREGWRVRADDRRSARAAKPGHTLAFTATAMSTIALEVHLPDGTQAQRATCALKSGNASRVHTWSAEAPSLELPPGAYSLTVSAGENNEFKSDPIPVEVRRGETTQLRVDLTGKPVLIVKLRFGQGERTGGEVVHMAVGSSELPTGAVLRARGTARSIHHRRHRQGQEPTVTVHDLLPGAYAIGFTRGSNREFDVIELVEVRAGLLEHELIVPPLDPADYVVLRIRGPSGKPIPNASIRTGYYTPNSSSSGSSPVVEKGEGVYYVLHHAHQWGKADDETWYVEVTAGALGKMRVEYDARTTRSLDLDFEEPARLEIQVKGVRGSAYEDAVHVAVAQGGGQAAGVACDRNGKGVATGLQPGEAELTIQVGTGHWRTTVHSESTRLASGDNRITLQLPPLYSVTLRNATGTVWVRAAESENRPRFHRHVTSAEGEAVIDALPAGEYTARCGLSSATFRVPGTSIVELRKDEGHK